MAIKPRSPGIQRISGEENIREIKTKKSEPKNGKFCIGCNRFFSYLKPEDKFCTSCKSRNQIIK